jgi:hypothetical protein
MPANLTLTKPLEAVIFDIEMKLERLGWIEISRTGDRRSIVVLEGRLMMWAIEAAKRSGTSEETIFGLLSKAAPDKQWRTIRQLLSEDALRVLDSKLTSFVMEDAA